MATSFQAIVIGTSLSEASDDVVRVGATLAQATGAVPWLVHVHSRPSSPSELWGVVDGTWREEHMLAVRKKLVPQAQRIGLTGLPGFGPAQLRPTMGSPYEEIVGLARQVQADLIVIGAAEGDRGVRRLLLGSTADGVIRRAPCPVFVVRSGATFPPRLVEIAVDLSHLSAHALRQGMDFLSRLGVGLAETEFLFVLDPEEVASSRHFRRSALDGMQFFLADNGVSSEKAQVRTGYPSMEILAVLKERQADLVILGTHERRGFKRFMLGSVATEVMHRAACNLLIVPPEDQLQQGAEAPQEENRTSGRSVTAS
ncbi:MAG: universal stress protein [Thermoanaerobaculia bacterium]